MTLHLELRDALWLISLGVAALIAWQNNGIRGALLAMDLKLVQLELSLTERIHGAEKDLAVLENAKAKRVNGRDPD